MPTYQDDFLTSDSMGAPPASPLVVPDQPGIGMAPTAHVPQTDLRQQAISQMGAGEKIFSALGEFGAGVTGRVSPLNQSIRMEREEKTRKLAEFKAVNDSIEDGVKMLQRLPEGERERFGKRYAQHLDSVSPGAGEVFTAFSSQPPALIKFVKDNEKDFPELAIALQADPTGKTVHDVVKSADFQKRALSVMDGKKLPLLLQKAQSFQKNWQQLVPGMEIDSDKDGRVSASELLKANETLKASNPELFKTVGFSDDDLQIINRNPKTFYGGAGILSPDDEADVKKDRLKRPAESDIGKIEADVKAGVITRAVADARIKKLSESGSEDRMTPATVSVNGKNVSALVNSRGEYFDANTRNPLKGIAPQITASQEKTGREEAQADASLQSVRTRINAMSKQLNEGNFLVGPAGVVRRTGEAVFGVVAPGMDTPAIDFQNNVRLLASDIRKTVEKDPNLSKDEREALYEMMGGGILQTPGSAIRALDNVLKYVEGKTPGNSTASIQRAVQAAGWSYEPEKYEYRIVGGIAQRKPKAQ